MLHYTTNKQGDPRNTEAEADPRCDECGNYLGEVALKDKDGRDLCAECAQDEIGAMFPGFAVSFGRPIAGIFYLRMWRK